MGNGKIVYEGIHEVINETVFFMRQSMHDGKEYGVEDVGRAGCLLAEEEAEYLLNGSFSGKSWHRQKKADNSVCPAYAPEKTVDITGFVVYGVIWNKQCRQMLWAEIPGGDEYYEYFENSKYRNWALEGYLKAEEIWDARILIGLMEKMRQTEDNDPAYDLLMRIIYAGYEGLDKWMADMGRVSGSGIRTHLFVSGAEKYDRLYCISEVVIAMVIAQDKGVEICFDHEMVQLLHFMESMEMKMRKYNEYGMHGRKLLEKEEEEYGKFLKHFREKYGTDCSLEKLVIKNGTKRMDNLLLGVMGQYHITPWMFYGMDLTEKEVQDLLKLDDRWTVESYWSMLVIAHLCKYIKGLKERLQFTPPPSARI